MIEIAEEQFKDKVWSKAISWVEQGRVSEKTETRGKAKEVLVVCYMFAPDIFKMKDEVVWQICLLECIVTEVWSLCHQSDLGGHRGLERTLSKFLKGFFLLSARHKIIF